MATSELPHPDQFLSGGELLLTTGLADRTGEEWDDLVSRLAALPVAALCFGTGLVHDEVPQPLLQACRRHDVTLLSSDVSIPFVQISQWVIERTMELREQRSRRLVESQDELVRRLLDGGDLRGVLRGIHSAVGGGTLSVVEPDGSVLASYPSGRPVASASGPDPGAMDLPVMVRRVLVARLRSQHRPQDPTLARFAATVLGLELARRQAWLAGSRDLLGHVLEDVLDRATPDPDSARRLRRHSVPIDSDLWVVVAVADASPNTLSAIPGLVSAPGESISPDGPWHATVRGRPTVLVPGTASRADEVATGLLDRLRRADPSVGVGVSGPHRGVPGLRLGWSAAQVAPSSPGVHLADRSSLIWLLLAAGEGPLAEVVERVLGPLHRHDQQSSSALVETVRCYLEQGGSVRHVADALGLHPNTVRQRLRTVERLTGSSLASTETRTELSLALRAYDLL